MDGNVDRSISSRSAAASNPVGIPVQTGLSLSQRVKLEYERDCFSRAEAQVRQRLLRLQVATGAMVKAIKRAAASWPLVINYRTATPSECSACGKRLKSAC